MKPQRLGPASAVTFVKTKLSKNSGNTSTSALESENIGSTTDSEMSIENAELKSTEQQEPTAQEES